MASFNVHVGGDRNMGTELLAAGAGVFPVELSAYQILMVCTSNWPR